jgi:hypothetical protein
MKLQDICKHDGDFLFYCDNATGLYGWTCGHGCGYVMNFDVDIATIRNRSELWWQQGVAYKQPTETASKILPKLVLSKA